MDPTTDAAIARLTLGVLAGGFAIGLAMGAVSQVTRFCTMGAFADLFTFGDAARLRMWGLAIAVAVLGTQGLIAAGAVDLTASIYTPSRLLWLSNLVGGVLFGIGMMLASGCATRSLVRAGSGSLKSLVVLIVMGLAAGMTLRGVFADLRVNGLEALAVPLAGPQDLASWGARLTGLPLGTARALACGAVVLALGAWLWRGRREATPAYLVGGVAVGVLVTLGWWVTAHLGYVAEHPATLEPAWLATNSRRPESLSFVAPLAYGLDLLLLWTDRSTVATFGVLVALGVLLGSAAASLARGQFRWETFREAGDTGHHLLGAVLMGVGGVTAMGCTVGQGVSGLSVLSVGAMLAFAGFAAGAWLGWRYLAWRLERSAG